MIGAVVVLSIAFLFAVGIAIVVARHARADLVALRDRHRADLRAEQDQFNVALGIVREHHREEVTRLAGVYAEMLKTVAGSTQEAIRLVTTGLVQPVAPEIAEREVDPQTRVARRVAEDTVERGMAELRAAYRSMGQSPTDEELREEVELLLLSGTMPDYPREPQRDGVPEAARA